MIQASLLNGAYVSQYDMRATANPGIPQYLEKVPFAMVSSEMYRLPVFVLLRALTAADYAWFSTAVVSRGCLSATAATCPAPISTRNRRRPR